MTAKEIGDIAGKYGIYECKEAKDAMLKELDKKKQKYEIIEIKYESQGRIVSLIRENVYKINDESTYISKNGYHVGVLYNGLVHCNVHPYGLPIVAWLNDFLSFGKFTVTPSKYQSLKIA